MHLLKNHAIHAAFYLVIKLFSGAMKLFDLYIIQPLIHQQSQQFDLLFRVFQSAKLFLLNNLLIFQGI